MLKKSFPFVTHKNRKAVSPCEVRDNTYDSAFPLCVMTYNIKNAENGTKISEIAADIRAETPDIVCLQEVDCGAFRSGKRDIMQELADSLQMHSFYAPTIKLRGGTYGIGMLSRYPLENHKQIPLPVRKGDEGRVVAQADITVSGRKLTIFNTHLSFETRAIRLAQLDYLQSVTSSCGTFILCGDFNTEDFSEFSRLSGAKAVNSAALPYNTYLGTDVSFFAIDNILISSDLSCITSKMAGTSVSDHCPLIAVISN